MATYNAIVYVSGAPQEIASADRLKNSGNVTRSGSAPGSPIVGDLWYDTTGLGDLKVYDGTSTWDSACSTPAATVGAFTENLQTISTDSSVTASRNAISVGPITVSDTKSMTVPSGSTWLIFD